MDETGKIAARSTGEALHIAAEGAARRRAAIEACERDGGHVYEVRGDPPWPCAFCGYTPNLPDTGHVLLPPKQPQ